MAIYQYNIDLIPRRSIIDKYGKIPDRIQYYHEESQKGNFESDLDFRDDLINSLWKGNKILFKEIEPFIDSFASSVEWSKHFTDSKSYGDNQTYDFTIELTKEGFIEDFNCRLDLRELDKNFINNILILAKRLDCLLIDRNNNIFEPNIEKLIENIKISDSYKFVTNPQEFLEKLSFCRNDY